MAWKPTKSAEKGVENRLVVRKLAGGAEDGVEKHAGGAENGAEGVENQPVVRKRV